VSEKSTEEGKAVYISLERGMVTKADNGCVCLCRGKGGCVDISRYLEGIAQQKEETFSNGCKSMLVASLSREREVQHKSHNPPL